MKEYSIGRTGHVLRYHDLPGKEMPILFIHGLGCAGSFDYPEAAVQGSLRNHRRILVDLLGAGYSDKPDDFGYAVEDHAEYLLEFIDHLNLGPFILFGHSLGGAIAIALADKCRDRLHQIILSESNLDKSSQGSTSGYIAGFKMEDFIGQGFSGLIKDSRENGNGMWAASMSAWLPKAAYLISKSASEGGNPSWRSVLYSLGCQKTFIFGENSLPDPDVQVLKEHGVQIEIVKQAGHSMAWENPGGLASAISRGIQSAK
ncbi:alpha/beta hydrolase [Caproiciproducens sp. NJN-50]|uniref:alpha/beta fold hydrolase n=1 Tax=Caproiciproducens sp. NJN-50 TaxID=2507162 RepID=UPI000FFE2035|nr:alpha/beta hydrolase [Caproiciproducens sp. NJN-50]QAT48828.1 alpha/beta hydrolase [Caproiciproducens sp. NJN-50]